jgi:hypothetical protein
MAASTMFLVAGGIGGPAIGINRPARRVNGLLTNRSVDDYGPSLARFR